MDRATDLARMIEEYDGLNLPSFPSIKHFSSLYKITRDNVDGYQKNGAQSSFADGVLFKYYTLKDFRKLNKEVKNFDKQGVLKGEREETAKKIKGMFNPVVKLVLEYIF